jgi:hypothetical protein
MFSLNLRTLVSKLPWLSLVKQENLKSNATDANKKGWFDSLG